MENKVKVPSWTIIIITMIVFYPVGIYLMYRRISLDRASALKNSKLLVVLGVIFLILGIVSLFGGSSDGVAAGLFMAVGGGAMLYASKRVREAGERYKKYINIVINQGERTIDNIAAQMGQDYQKTCDGLQEMIDKGFFANAHLDLANHEIVFPAVAPVAAETAMDISNAATAIKLVKCPNCGGNNSVPAGRVSECDFCGSPLQG